MKDESLRHKILFVFSLLMLLITMKGSAQKESNIWYFGLHAGINFDTSPPGVLTDGQTNSREGVAAISDKYTGKLLFYTEGTTVWDADQQVMPNGMGLQGDYSSTQSAIIVPDPSDSNNYYIFTTAGGKGLRYSKVDMTLHGGKGDIIDGAKNSLLIPGNESTEKLIATRHCNGKDYWVITHTLNDDRYYVFLVTAAGIQPPLIFHIGSVIHTGGGEITSYLKISPDGNLIANAFGNPAGQPTSKVEVLHFNNQTGSIGSPLTKLDGLPYPYGVEFSPDGNLLYVSTQQGAYIYQYDLRKANINDSRTLIYSSSHLKYGALQLGPDGKIYVSAENGNSIGYDYLGVINNPNIIGNGCNFIPDAIFLQGKQTLIGLPTFVGSFFYHPVDFHIADTCLGSETKFTIGNFKNIDSVKWDFGDNTYSEDLNPAHEYKAAKSYTVELIIYHPCRTDTAQKTLTIHNTYSSVNEITICEGNTYVLPDGKVTGKAGVYMDSLKTIYGCDSVITTNLTVNPSFHETVYDSICSGQSYILPDDSIVNQPGKYMSVFHTQKGCDSIITTILSYRNTIEMQYTDTICAGATMLLPDGQEIDREGIYKITRPSTTGCDTVATYYIFVKSPPVIDLGTDTCLLAGQQLLLDPGQGYSRYEWQNGSAQPTLLVTSSGMYHVKVSNECGFSIDSVKVTMDCLGRIFVPSAFSPNGDGMNDIFRILNVHGQKLLYFSIFDRWGKRVFYTTNISEGWDGTRNGQRLRPGTYIYLIRLVNDTGEPKIYKGTVLLLH